MYYQTMQYKPWPCVRYDNLNDGGVLYIARYGLAHANILRAGLDKSNCISGILFP